MFNIEEIEIKLSYKVSSVCSPLYTQYMATGLKLYCRVVIFSHGCKTWSQQLLIVTENKLLLRQKLKLTRILANRFSISLTSLGMGCCFISPLVDALRVLVRMELVSCDRGTRVVAGRALRVLLALLWPPPSTDGGPLALPLRLPILASAGYFVSADSTWSTHTGQINHMATQTADATGGCVGWWAQLTVLSARQAFLSRTWAQGALTDRN